MPLLPASLSSLNQKVESARKNFNSTLDKAGEKTGVFKPSSTTATNNNQLYQQSSNYHQDTLQSKPPPPPPRLRSTVSHSQLTPPPPPPPRRHHPAPNYPQAELPSYHPPPPVATKPTPLSNPPTPYRPPLETINGYGPPSFPPVQPSSRYGPPSPLRSPSELHHQSVLAHPLKPSVQPPSSNGPTNWNKPAPVPQVKTLERSIGTKNGQIPFPPFSQFTESDKHAFFEMLDEFFALKFPNRKSTTNNNLDPKGDSQPSSVLLNTRPSAQVTANLSESDPSRAELVARYVKNHRQWSSHTDQWYSAEDPVPTPVQGSEDVKRMSSWSQTGNNRTQINYILFPDLSQIWTQVFFDVNRPFPPRSASAKYRPPPVQIDAQNLTQASKIYGTQIVLFAENAERSGRHVARGECWDLANEALKAFPAGHLRVSPPLTSISRTHGILLYYGHSSSKVDGFGSWKQFNDFGVIRPGDIIEWRLVACDTVNPTLSCTLGDPEHTAIIIEATGCTIDRNGFQDNCPPHQLGYITVVEQSLKQIPVRRTYDLSTISRGEVWIYRPMDEQILLGSGANECSFPPPHPSFEP